MHFNVVWKECVRAVPYMRIFLTSRKYNHELFAWNHIFLLGKHVEIVKKDLLIISHTRIVEKCSKQT